MARGSGTHARLIFEKIFGKSPAGGCGGCKKLLDEMDSKGTEWCRKNVNTIVPTIRKNAQKFPDWRAKVLSHIPGVEAPIYAMVYVAIGRAETELAEEKAAAELAEKAVVETESAPVATGNDAPSSTAPHTEGISL